MKIDVRARGFELTEALSEHVRRRFGTALLRHRPNVDRVAIELRDVNGPRGGADKLCRVLVRLRRQPMIVIQDLGLDMYGAIDRAADRARRNVARRLAHLRAVQHGGGWVAEPAV